MDDWVDVDTEIKAEGSIPIRSARPTKSTTTAINFYATIEKGARKRLEMSQSPIFQVELDRKSLYQTFVENLAPELQQEYTCSACKHFVYRYGHLALVNKNGDLEPLLWWSPDLKGHTNITRTFAKSVQTLQKIFEDKKVIGEFKVVEKVSVIGLEKDGSFCHMHLGFPKNRFRKQEPAAFASADTDMLANMLDRVLADYNLDTIRKVHTILFENKVPHADNHKASAKWLLELVEDNKMGKATGQVARHNLLYRYAASSFIGSLKQMRSGALSVLLEGVKQDLSWNDILGQWRQICDPISYMRPQAAPSQGNIHAAEKLFEQLGLTKDDLKRRLLVQEDVPENVVIWRSDEMKHTRRTEATAGVFSAVKAKQVKQNALVTVSGAPAAVMTFTRFVTKVLPTAKKVHCWLGNRDRIATLITGYAGTKPLMQWHDDEGENLASHYFWINPKPVESHNLKSNAWNEVRCLIPFPSLWDGAPLTTTFPLVDPDGEEGERYKYYHKQKGFRYVFVLEENHESCFSSLHLFPETLKSEFHGIRSTIEAFCKTEKVADVEDGMARGGFVAGVHVNRSAKDEKLKFRVEKFNGEIGLYDITLFE